MRKILFKKHRNFSYRICIACLFFHIAFCAKADKNVDSIKSAISTRGNDTVKVNLLNQLSFFYVQTRLDSVLYFAEAAKTIGEQIKYRRGAADALVNLTRYYQNKGAYSSAIENCLAALRLYETIHAIAPAASATLLLAQVSKDMSGQNRTAEYIDKGIAYSKEAYEMCRSINDSAGMAGSLNMSGVLFRDKAIKVSQRRFFDTAFANYTEAVQLIERSGKGAQHLARLYNNISQVYIEHFKNYNEGLNYLFKAIAINEGSNNRLSLSYNYGNVSNAYILLHDYDKAVKYARLMLQYAQEVQRPSRIQDALYQFYQVYRASNQPDSALYYYILSDRINDSITDIAKTSQVTELQTKYETGKKQMEINLLHTESVEKNKRIVILAVVLALLALLVIAMVLLYQRVQKQKHQITLQSKKLEVMMKELHHRVKNNLQIVSSLLSLQTYKLEDEATISVLRESQQRVQAMSLIHQKLYKTEDITCVNMKEYVTDLAETLLSAYGYEKDDFDLQLDIQKETLDVDKALPVGLMINEMVTNSMKYAYENTAHPVLKISLTEYNNHVVLTIKDNGKGLDENEWKQKKGSFGKQLITVLGKQLRAKQTILVDNGTQFTVTIPVKEAA